MRKTSVYLNEDEAEGLQRVSAATGKPQAELIREGVRLVIREMGAQPRTFRSLGRGHGGGNPYARWQTADLYKKAMGSR